MGLPFAELPVSLQIFSFGAIAWILYLSFNYIQQKLHERHLLPLPPGPKGKPFIGNLPEVIAASKIGEQHLLFEKWAREYGELYKVKVGPFTQYMVSSDLAVKAIFEKPAAVSANRPTWLVSSQHMCNGWYVFFSFSFLFFFSFSFLASLLPLTLSISFPRNVLLINADTPRWKYQRKITWGNVGSIPRADAALPFLHYETLKFIHEVAHDPSTQRSGPALWNAIMRYTYSNFSTQMLGFDVPHSSDPAIKYVHETGVAQILGTLPGAYLVDIMPFLDYLPLFLKPWERAGRARFQRDKAWSVDKLERMKAMKDRSAVRESLLCKIVEDEKNLGFPFVEEGAHFALMLTIGAADTTQMSTWAFVEAMMSFPDVQKRARDAIDAVVGDRIPYWEDYEKIPYVSCIHGRFNFLADNFDSRSDVSSKKPGVGDHQ